MLPRSDAREVLAEALHHFHRERWFVGDFVIMPNHAHGLFQPLAGFELEDVLASVKRFTSTQLTELGIKSGRFWQQDSYDRIVREGEELAIWRRYMESNPKKARLSEGEFTHYQCEWLD